MSKTLKMVSLVVAMVLIVGVIATVAILSSEKSTANAASASSAAATKEVGDPALIVDGEKITDPGTILTVGDTEFSFDEYRYYYMSNLNYYTTYMGTDFTTAEGIKQAASVKTTVDETLTDVAALLQIAKDEGIALTEEEKTEIQTSLQNTKDSLGDDFETQLRSAYMVDEAFYLKLMEQSQLAQKAEDFLKEQILADEESKAELEDGIVSAKHILIPFETTTTDSAGSSTSLSEEQIAKNKAEAKELADSLSKQIKDSSDPVATFETLFTEYQANDPGQTEAGYTFGEGQMVDSFYNGALALKEDEISEPIESSYGYHIILRLPLDQEYVDTNLETLASTKLTTLIDEKIAPIAKKLEITYGEYYKDISPSTVE